MPHPDHYLIGEYRLTVSLNQLESPDGAVHSLEPRAAELLAFLAERQGEVISVEALLADLWQGRVVTDSSVYRLVAELRRLLGDDSRSPNYIETVRKRGYRLVAPVTTADAPPARDERAPRTTSPTRLALAATAIALVAAVGLVANRTGERSPDTTRPESTRASSEYSIAVLPFVNMSGDSDKDYLGEGLSEDILTALSGIPGLRVAARTSSYYFQGRDIDVAEIAEQLEVRSILEGSVRVSGDTIRVTAQLIDVSNGFQLWAKTFDRELDDVLSVQTDIATAVTNALRQVLLRQAGYVDVDPVTDDANAYDAYLLGRYELEQGNAASLSRAAGLFERAIALDPEFAQAYAGLADVFIKQFYNGGRSADEAYSEASRLIARALYLKPALQYGRRLEGIAEIVRRRLDKAVALLSAATERNPNDALAWRALGFAHVLQGDLELAEVAYEAARDLDPLNAALLYNAGALQMLRGRYDLGAALFDRVVSIAPQRRGSTRRYHAGWAGRYGRHEEAAEILTGIKGLPPADAMVARLQLLTDVGLWDEAELRLNQAAALTSRELIDETGTLLVRQGRARELADPLATRGQVQITGDTSGPALPDSRRRSFWRGYAELAMGRYGAAEEHFRAALGDPADANIDYFDRLLYLTFTLQQQNQAAAADELLRRGEELVGKAQRQGWQTPRFVMETARLAVLNGAREEALATLRDAVDRGWLVAGHLEHDPLWASVREDPEFQAIQRQVAERLAYQRARVIEIFDAAHSATPPDEG